MIRSAIVSLLFLPALAAASAAPCGTTPDAAPLPSSLPTPEMLHSAPALANCVDLISFTQRLRQPVAAPASVAAPAPNAYVPKTEFDNSPWRFNMNQNGRRMTADEFAAWMQAKGIRVATGKPGGAAAAPASVPALPAAAVGCVPSATVTC